MCPAPVVVLDPRPVAVPIVPVAGTHGYRGTLTGEWWCPGSPVLTFLDAEGFPLLSPERPFVWTTDVNGWRFWRRWFGFGDPHHDWTAGGHAFYAFLRPFLDHLDTYIPIRDRNAVVHSHGLQVALYACQFGLKLNSLVSVMSPVRTDMLRVAFDARPNIGYWEHVRADKDRFQWWGAIGDGHVGIDREHPLADRNTRINGASHAKLLRDPAWFSQWREAGILQRLRGAGVRPSVP